MSPIPNTTVLIEFMFIRQNSGNIGRFCHTSSFEETSEQKSSRSKTRGKMEGRRDTGRREAGRKEGEFCRPSVLKEDSQPEIFYSSVTAVLHLSCVL